MTISSTTRSGGNAFGLPVSLCGTLAPSADAGAVPEPTASPVASPDATLMGLGQAWMAMERRCAELDASADSTPAEKMAARGMKAVLGRRIAGTPARTLAGLDVKALLPNATFNA